jgi:hypothetical protein
MLWAMYRTTQKRLVLGLLLKELLLLAELQVLWLLRRLLQLMLRRPDVALVRKDLA